MQIRPITDLRDPDEISYISHSKEEPVSDVDSAISETVRRSDGAACRLLSII